MLTHLHVKNYALIESLDLSWAEGFTAITGETGAGKSILLGALSLILGQRADLKALSNSEKKCVIEGHFSLKAADHQSFFEERDLDFESDCIIRREILPSGKSRAFLNDSPVKLEVLSALSASLIDVHSQHQNLLLRDENFQLDLLDAYADNQREKAHYQQAYHQWRAAAKDLEQARDQAEQESGDTDYLQFLFDELANAQLVPGEQEELEAVLQRMEHAGDIQIKLAESLQLLQDNEVNVLDMLRAVQGALGDIVRYDDSYEEYAERLRSVQVELDDLRQGIEERGEQMDFDPQEKAQKDQRLSQLMALQKKHQVQNTEDLIAVREQLESRILAMSNLEERLESLALAEKKSLEAAGKAAKALSTTRNKALPALEKAVLKILVELHLPHAQFVISMEPRSELSQNGMDQVNYRFSANKGRPAELLSKTASGGEISRVMLALKSIMARTKSLPTIIFDEIDTGVSGETAGKIGSIMQGMGDHMQVISITHLPQIAALGHRHLKVYKTSEREKTLSHLKDLSDTERIEEIARLLSGDVVSDAAKANARSLLSLN